MKKIKLLTPILGLTAITGIMMPLVSCGPGGEDKLELNFSVTTNQMNTARETIIELDWEPSEHSLELSNYKFKYDNGSKEAIVTEANGDASRPQQLKLTFANDINNDITDGVLSFHCKDKTSSKEANQSLTGLTITAPTELCITANEGKSCQVEMFINDFKGEQIIDHEKIKFSSDRVNWEQVPFIEDTVQDDKVRYKLNTPFTLDNNNQKIYIKNDANTLSYHNDNEDYGFLQIKVSGDNGEATVSGRANSLINGSGLQKSSFFGLFAKSSAIKSIDNLILPYDLADNCYEEMFGGCTGLTTLPENLLPSTELTTGCYQQMFDSCSALTSIPEGLLPATKLKQSCYMGMFNGCSGLETLPENLLPAKSLPTACYCQMFAECKSLTKIISFPDNFEIQDDAMAVLYCMFYCGSASEEGDFALKIAQGQGTIPSTATDSGKIFTCPQYICDLTGTDPNADQNCTMMFAGCTGKWGHDSWEDYPLSGDFWCPAVGQDYYWYVE